MKSKHPKHTHTHPKKPPTWFRREVTHQAGKEAVDCPQNLGVATGHARGDASLQRFEATQDRGRLEDSQEKTEDL